MNRSYVYYVTKEYLYMCLYSIKVSGTHINVCILYHKKYLDMNVYYISQGPTVYES